MTDKRIITHTEVPDDTSLAQHLAQDMDPAFFTDGVPEQGWLPEHYPQLTTAFIPYTTDLTPRGDPHITITATGWMFIEVGNIRLAIPDREEWDKLLNMGERMWNSWQASRPEVEPEAPTTFVEDQRFNPPNPPPPGVSTQEATAAAIGGIVAPPAFEEMIHRAATEEGDTDDPRPAH